MAKLVSIIGLFKLVSGGGSAAGPEPVQTQWLAPSSIHFLRIQGTRGADPDYRWNSDSNGAYGSGKHRARNGLVKVTSPSCEDGAAHPCSMVPLYLPKKLQVTEKNGTFVALDNNSLQLMRHLEKLGHCTEVEVEIVPLSKVPPNIVTEILDIQQHHKRMVASCAGNKKQQQQASNQKNRSTRTRNERKHHYEKNNCNCKPRNMGEQVIQCNNDELVKCVHTLGTRLGSTPTTSTSVMGGGSSSAFGINGATFNTYLSEQQLRAARMTNTMTVMAPCLRQPITTSTPASEMSLYHFKWNYCCSEQVRHQTNTTAEDGQSGEDVAAEAKFGM